MVEGLAWSNDPESYVSGGSSIATGRDRSHTVKKYKSLETWNQASETSTEWKMTFGKEYGLLSRYMECETLQ
jgi:hypothetical protein